MITLYNEGIIKTYKEIFPQILDNEYIKLLNNIKDYEKLMFEYTQLRNLDLQNSRDSFKNISISTEEQALTQKFLESVSSTFNNDYLKNIGDNLLDIEKLNSLQEQLEKLKKITRNYSEIGTKTKNLKKRNEVNIKFEELTKKLDILVNSIQDNLEKIDELDKVNNKKFSNIKIENRHFDKFNRLKKSPVDYFSTGIIPRCFAS